MRGGSALSQHLQQLSCQYPRLHTAHNPSRLNQLRRGHQQEMAQPPFCGSTAAVLQQHSRRSAAAQQPFCSSTAAVLRQHGRQLTEGR